MPRPSITWITSDTHFNHDVLVHENLRPPDNKKLILSEWKRLIAKQDTLIHLGDVIFYQYQELKGILDSVPCRKILTRGNHDKKTNGWYQRNGFDFVCDGMRLGEYYFTHKPEDYLVNVHGHLHLHDTIPGKVLISLEKLNYKLVKFDNLNTMVKQ